MLSFETAEGDASSTGTQISNVELPSTVIRAGPPIQASWPDVPDDGLALVIGTDDEPSNVQTSPRSAAAPPLEMDAFDEGSSTGGGPSLSLRWFACGDEPLLTSLKEGPC